MQQPHQLSAGFALIETLVAMVILTIGLLGVLALQNISLNSNHTAYLRTQATLLASDMADRIRANLPAVEHYDGFDSNHSLSADPGCIHSGCTESQLALHDLSQWGKQFIREEKPLLPDGRGVIRQEGDFITISILWHEKNSDGMQHRSCISSQDAEYACLSMSFRP